jgi:hypothetical protein
MNSLKIRLLKEPVLRELKEIWNLFNLKPMAEKYENETILTVGIQGKHE